MVINDNVYINLQIISFPSERMQWRGIMLIETMETKSGVLNGREK